MSFKLQPYLDISQSCDAQSLERRLMDFSQDLEFDLINAIVVEDNPGATFLATTIGVIPAGFVDTYNDPEIGKRNPVLQRLKHSSIPFAYDQALYIQEGASALYEHQAQYGYRHGIAVAMHLRDNKHFVLGLDRVDALPSDADRMTELMAAVQLLAVHAQHAAFKFFTPICSPRAPLLTPRELEILQWTHDGKSSWAVGQLVGISENTVNFHVRNAAKKLDASSKHQAVLKAMSFGLI
jgi:DNA-binding CsgD family transcriptional regulator